MTYEWRLVIVGFAAFAAANVVVSLIAARLWRRLLTEAPVARASALLSMRLAPVAASLIAATLVTAGYSVFERRDDESMGVVLPALALFGCALVATGAIRAWRLHRATRRTVSGWLRSAEPIVLNGARLPVLSIDSAFPVVAVVGLWRPRLLVARQVLASCSGEELHAIVAHEQSHVARRDNLRRAVLTTAPDMLAWLPASRALQAAWHDASEETADDAASRQNDTARVALAQALIRVARLAPRGGALQPLPASALYRGENLDRRIRRLLVPPAAAPGGVGRWPAAAALALTAIGLSSLDDVQHVVEAAVTYLP